MRHKKKPALALSRQSARTSLQRRTSIQTLATPTTTTTTHTERCVRSYHVMLSRVALLSFCPYPDRTFPPLTL